MRKLVAAAALTIGAVMSFPALAPADAASNSEFGRHVATCAQEHGLDGGHNPGMHQGRSAWDGAGC